MRTLTLCVLIPFLCTVGPFLVFLYAGQSVPPLGTVLLTVLLFGPAFPAGIWVHRVAKSTLHLAGAIVGAVGFLGFWVWLLRDFQGKLFLFTPGPLDYLEGCVPILVLVLGYTSSVLLQRGKSPV